MSWKSAPSSTRFSVAVSSPSSSPTVTDMSRIHWACVDVYSSLASRALASASTVERNVRSRRLEGERVRQRELRLAGDRTQELELPVVQAVGAVERERDRAPADVEADRDDRVGVGEDAGEVVRDERARTRRARSRTDPGLGRTRAAAAAGRRSPTWAEPVTPGADQAPRQTMSLPALSLSGSQTDVRSTPRMRAPPRAMRSTTSSSCMPDESSRESSRSAFAPFASRRSAS